KRISCGTRSRSGAQPRPQAAKGDLAERSVCGMDRQSQQAGAVWLRLDSRAKCNRALREPDLHVFAKLFQNCLKRGLEAQAFSGREIGGDDDVLDFLVGHFVDVDLTRQPAS